MTATSTTTEMILDAALDWHRAGACVIPAQAGKRPHSSWRQYTITASTEDEIRGWFGTGEFDGFGVVTGATSGNLEMFEFEGRARHLVDDLAEAMIDHGLADLYTRVLTGYLEETPSGGLHLYYRISDGPAAGNTKIAERPATPEELAAEPGAKRKTMIETRGEGGFSVVAPSGGRVHPEGGEWVALVGTPATIPTITVEERDALFAVTHLLDEMPEPAPRPTPTSTSTKPIGDGGGPGDEFNYRASWEEILEPHGWQRGHTDHDAATYWTRPGKNPRDGISATTRVEGGFYVFSTSTEFEAEKPYTKFATFALLEHGGDYGAAARDLGARGYGEQRPRPNLRAEFATGPQTSSSTPTSAPQTAEDDEDGFWSSRPILAHLRTFARARMTSPWAVLGVVLARTATAVPFTVTLPPIIGSHASINTFVGIVGRSGSGKGAAEAAAEDAILMGEITTARVGSGEGLAHQYIKRVKDQLEWLDHSHARLFSVQEIDTLTALDQRRGSTLLAELRMAWAGERLGFGYADPTKRLEMPRHAYRLALVVGIQPGRAGGLLDDTDGGTPQRFLWMPATDPGAPDTLPVEPRPWRWELPRLPAPSPTMRVMRVCDEAVEFVRANRRADLRGDVAAVDAHAILCRLKVAAVLAVLDGRFEVTVDDWHLAGVVDAKSRQTREAVRATLVEAAMRTNRARGEAEADRVLITTAKVERSTVARVAHYLVKVLTGREWMSTADLRRRLASRDRQWFEAAVEAAVDAGQIEVEHAGRDDGGHGGQGARYRVRGER